MEKIKSRVEGGLFNMYNLNNKIVHGHPQNEVKEGVINR